MTAWMAFAPTVAALADVGRAGRGGAAAGPADARSRLSSINLSRMILIY
jgi:hypothetical protein